MNKVLILFVTIPALALAGLYAYVFYTGPRMKVQPHIRAYQSVAPHPPKGTVAVEPPVRLKERGEETLKSPLAGDGEAIRRGRVYYQYYCVFCHGEEGRGDGPVGQSYVPRPADLHSGTIKGYGDGRLLRAMLTGLGHEPVLEQIVPPQHRWYLVAFVRSFR